MHKLTTGGEFLDTFGQEGSGAGQFNGPWDIKISPKRKVYVTDRNNNRIQVFHSDWTLPHIIDGKVLGERSFTKPVAHILICQVMFIWLDVIQIQ